MSYLTVMQARAAAVERQRDLAARLAGRQAARDRGRTVPAPPAGGGRRCGTASPVQAACCRRRPERRPRGRGPRSRRPVPLPWVAHRRGAGLRHA